MHRAAPSLEQHLGSCPVCQSNAVRWAVKTHNGVDYPIDRCSACGYGFVNPRPSPEFLEVHYSQSGHGKATVPSVEWIIGTESADPNSTIDARRMISTIQRLTRNRRGMSGRFLDVGAGYGYFSREAVNHAFHVIAINPAADEREVAKSVSGIEPVQTTFEALRMDPASLSVILMSQVLEHVLDVNQWLSKAWELLEHDGILAIALPNFGSLQRLILREKEPYICPPTHLNFFTGKALTKLLRGRGFRIETVQHVSRIPKAAIRRRVHGAAAPVATPVWFVANQLLHIVDAVGFGSIINVYARKATNGADLPQVH